MSTDDPPGIRGSRFTSEARWMGMTERPSDAQLRSAADRIRRLSDGVMDPDREAADLAPLAEEALRRTYRIIELGVEFWMGLLRLDPSRALAGGGSAEPEGRLNSGWQFGRALGATIRSWGDLKNARRGHLWFDSSPLLGPRMSEREKRDNLEPVPRLLTESSVGEITAIVAQHYPADWSDAEGKVDPGKTNRSRELFWLGLFSGALERELRNPQTSSDRHLERRTTAAIAFTLEREPKRAGGEKGSEEEPLLEPLTAQALEDRLGVLKSAQGGRDRQWRPLYSFLRPGDVVVIALASEDGVQDSGDREVWGKNWRRGIPLALAIVTARSNWDADGWWGRIGSVLFLDGPRASRTADSGGSIDLQRLRTAFRFPDPEIRNPEKSQMALAFGLREPTKDELRRAIGVLPLRKTTDDLGLERFRLYRQWLADEYGNSGKGAGPENEALVEPIPAGFAGPWRNASEEDLRATLGEFLELRTRTLRVFERRDGLPDDSETGYQANLDIERFALTSDNIRLGIFFDNPVRDKARASAQRIAPDPLPDEDLLKTLAFRDGATEKEGRRIDVANAHRRMFDLYKRGLPVEGEASEGETASQRARRRAASFLPAIALDPSLDRSPDPSFESSTQQLRDSNVFLLWNDRMNESDGKSPIDAFVDEVSNRLDGINGPGTICGAFPRSEKGDLDRATYSRAFRGADLEATDTSIPIDPAGTRTRQAVLVTKKESERRLLIVLTDDSVAAVDLGAIIWLLLAYEKLEAQHILDFEAHKGFLERNPGISEKKDPEAEAGKLQREALSLLAECAPGGTKD